MALGYVVPLIVSAENAGKANVTINPTTKEQPYRISRNGKTVDLTNIRVGDSVDFKYEWSIPSSQEPKAGDSFEFDLPRNVDYSLSQNGKFTSEGGKQLGEFEISSSRHVKLSFHEFGQTQDGIRGPLNVSGVIVNPSESDYNLTFDGFPDNANRAKSYPINSSDPSDITITLHGVPSTTNPNRYVIRNSQKLSSETIVNRTNKIMTTENTINTSFSDNLDLESVQL